MDKEIDYEKIVKLIISNPDLNVEEIAFIANVPKENVEMLILEILKHYESENNDNVKH